MEHHSQANTPLEAQLRECFGRVVYSTKAHEKSADACTSRLAWIKGFQIVLAALTTGGLLVAVFGDPKVSQVATILSTVVSTLLLAINSYMKDVDPGQQAEKHKKTASALWNVRESYLSLLADLRSGAVTGEEARKKRDELQAHLVEVYAAAPRTTRKSYLEASEGLKNQEELTFRDEEIDKFLPAALRVSKGE
jgi:hypothetical protein